MIYFCQECHGEYKASPSDHRKYCSIKCYAEWQKRNTTPPSRKGQKMPEGYVNWQKGKDEWGVWYDCEQCGRRARAKVCDYKKAKHHFCSRRCTAHYYHGDGTKTPASKLLRLGAEFKKWRKKVFERDNYTCQSCKERGGVLHPHHLKPFATFPELRFEVSNGQTLCKECHMKTDTCGRKKSTAESWQKGLL